MATKQPLISCPNCGQEFELDKAFAEHFEDEKRKAVAQAIDTFKKKTEEERIQLENDFEEERKELKKQIQQQAQDDAEKKYKLEIESKDQELKRIQKQLEELEKRTRQGSMELQGEALESYLKEELTTNFPLDTITDVKKGQSGADITHSVINTRGQRCGTILWEAKNTKNWNDSWLRKIKDDASQCNAQVMVIVSVALPDGIKVFDLRDGVWVCSVETVSALARIIRENLLHVTNLHRAMDGQGTKMEAVYTYLTSMTFRDRVQRMVETWESLKKQIEAEERAMQKQWKERRKQLDIMINVTTDMYTDISCIIGGDMPRVAGLSLEALPAGEQVQ